MRIKITNCTIMFSRSDGSVSIRNNQNIELNAPDNLWGYDNGRELIKYLLRGHRLRYMGHPFYVTPMSKVICYDRIEARTIQQIREDKLSSLGIDY